MGSTSSIKKDQRREQIISGSLYKVIITLSLPIMLSNFIQTLYNLADTYFVARFLGELQMNAIGIIWPIVFSIIGLGGGLSLGAVALISKHIGADDKEGAKKASGQILVYLFSLGVILSILGYFISPYILNMMKVTGETYKYALQYLNIIFYSVPFTFLFFAFQAIEQAQGNMTVPMIASGISVFLNIVLDPLFIVGLDLGVSGAAYATIISRILLGAGSVLFYFISSKTRYKPSFRQLKPDLKVIGEISRTGVPASFGRVTSSVGFMILNGLVLSYGNDVLSAYIIGNRIVSLVMMPCMGIGSALSTIVGQNIGAGRAVRAKEAFIKSLKVSMGFAVIGITMLLIMSEGFIGLFTDSESIFAYTKEYAFIVTLAMPLMSLFDIWSGLFIGADRGTYAMIVMTSRLWIYRIPSILILKNVVHMDEHAIWYPMIISNALACLTGYFLYKRGDIFGEAAGIK